MAFQLSIKDDLKKLERQLGAIAKDVLPRAVPAALNKTGRSVQSVAIKKVSEETKVKQKTIRKNVVPMAFTASRRRPYFTVNFTRAKASNLIDFVAPSRRNTASFRRRTKKGFKHKGVIANAWGQRKEYKGTFIGRGRNSGKLLVFKRDSGKIKSVAGPSPRKTFERESVQRAMIKAANQRLPIELNRAIKFRLSKL